MIDPFRGIDAAPITRRVSRTINWLNIFGDNKSCKTAFCASLQERLRCVHFDFDFQGGTSQQLGTFLTCSNLKEYGEAYRLVFNGTPTIKPQVVIADPLNILYDLLEEKFMHDEGITNIEWKQWGPMRDLLKTAVRKLCNLAPLLITTHSFRVSAIGKDTNKVTIMDMDVPQKIQKWIEGSADANLHFHWETLDDGTERPVYSVKNIGLTDTSLAGSRAPELYNMHTLDELRNYIFKMFDVDDASLKEAA